MMSQNDPCGGDNFVDEDKLVVREDVRTTLLPTRSKKTVPKNDERAKILITA